MARVTGIGGFFFRAKDPDALNRWYGEHFGVIELASQDYDDDGWFQDRGETVFFACEPGSSTPGPPDKQWSINFRVDDLDAMVERLRAAGIEVEPHAEEYPNGRFAELEDPEGNHVQLWEPNAASVARDPARRVDAASPLGGARIATRLPCQDLERARRFYRDVLGLEPAEERDGGLLYHGSSGSFALFASAGRSSGESTQMAFEVDDLDAVVAALKARGLEFEEVDMPGLETRDGIVQVEGNYPSKGGRGERAVWFRDSEGNLMGLGQPT